MLFLLFSQLSLLRQQRVFLIKLTMTLEVWARRRRRPLQTSASYLLELLSSVIIMASSILRLLSIERGIQRGTRPTERSLNARLLINKAKKPSSRPVSYILVLRPIYKVAQSTLINIYA
jgi:hypothetical protein